jgi:RNA polymerase sigma-70 factor (ECF subfamily)
MTDNELIKLILQGDRNKFALIVEKYKELVFHTCMGFLHNKDDADDLTQEVFIQAYQSLSKFKMESALSTWLYRISVNASLNKLRKESGISFLQRLESMFSGEVKNDPPFSASDLDNPENILIRQEHSQWIQKALDSLPENQRTAIILSKYDDLPQKEIAEIMDVTEGAVEALLQRAKKNLREKLSGDGQRKSKKQRRKN